MLAGLGAKLAIIGAIVVAGLFAVMRMLAQARKAGEDAIFRRGLEKREKNRAEAETIRKAVGRTGVHELRDELRRDSRDR